jgi:hypothetical protein
MRTVIIALLTILIFLVMPGFADEIPIGKCNVTMDFENSSISFTQSNTTVKGNTITDMTVLVDEATNTPGFIYIMDFPVRAPQASLKSGLEYAMKALARGVSIERYNDGYIGTGLFVSGGQKTWGVVLPLDMEEDRFNRIFVAISCFENETFNEHLIKGVKIENIKCS